jgi:Rad3-related DNA helicase
VLAWLQVAAADAILIFDEAHNIEDQARCGSSTVAAVIANAVVASSRVRLLPVAAASIAALVVPTSTLGMLAHPASSALLHCE